jgi:hypothetical protein
VGVKVLDKSNMSPLPHRLPPFFGVGDKVRVAVKTTLHTAKTGIVTKVYDAHGVYRYVVDLDNENVSCLFFGFELSKQKRTARRS